MEKKLRRPLNDRMLSGVCAGIARYFDVDPTLVRVLFAVATVVGVGSPILIYIVLIFVMPNEPALP
ncbi:MAG: PspC domain-containing protein [Ferruginibacter sp.]|nr:PspC domain-containing protein [Cytophagales bacterium]